MKDYYLLDEVEELTGIPANTLRTRLNRPGNLAGIKVPKIEGGSKLVWALTWPTIEILRQDAPKENVYQKALETWKREQRMGFRRPTQLKENTIERNEYGVIAFWDYLDEVKPCEKNDLPEMRKKFGKPPSIERITTENIALSIANVPKRNTPTRENIYKAMMSFYRSLVHHGLKSEIELLRFKNFKPAPNKRPRRTFVKDIGTFDSLLLENQAWYNGRSKYDRLLTDILLRFAYFTGLRNTEICNLMLKDIDFKEMTVYVEFGKGDKEREIGLELCLDGPLKEYLKKRPPSKSKNFFLQEDGNPLNRRVVSNRIRNLASRIDLDLTPHGLRRTLITSLLIEGTPSVLVKQVAGHNRLSTTEKYDMTTSRDAVNVTRNRGQAINIIPPSGSFEF